MNRSRVLAVSLDGRYLGGPMSTSLQFQLTPADIAYCRTQADCPDARGESHGSGARSRGPPGIGASAKDVPAQKWR
jgi:hypothetical protein